MGTTSVSADECPICREESSTRFQCCSNKEDSLCESCWTHIISTVIKNGKVGLLLNGKLPCELCHKPIHYNHLPAELQIQLNQILLTIPKTKDPKTVEEFNYSYNNSIELHNCLTKEKFIFLTQRHYNLLGNCIDTYIQTLMKNNPWNYEEIWLPIKDEITNDHHDQVNIFASDDFKTNENGCLILIQGSGVVRPGQWARSCCINETLDIGAMFPYMIKAKEHKLSVIILNPNQTSYSDEEITVTNNTSLSNKEATPVDEQTTVSKEENAGVENMITEASSGNEQIPVANEDAPPVNQEANSSSEKGPNEDMISFYLSSDPLPRPSTKKIPNLSTSREHILYAYENIIAKLSPAKQFYIVAHSAGGDGVMYLLRKRQDDILPRIAKIAFTDSVHSILPFESNEIRNFLKANAIHFVASDQPMGASIDYRYDFSQQPACQEVSAGHPKHEYTSGYCVKGVFDFFFPSNEEEEIEKTKL